MPDYIPLDISAGVTLTSQAAARGYYGAASSYVTLQRFTNVNEARLIARKLGVAGFAGATVSVAFSAVNPGSAFVTGDWTDIASVVIAATNTVLDSGWVNIPAAALQGQDVYLALLMAGGNATLSPVMGQIGMYLR